MNHEKPSSGTYEQVGGWEDGWDNLEDEDVYSAPKSPDTKSSSTLESHQPLDEQLASKLSSIYQQNSVLHLVGDLYDGSPWDRGARAKPEKYVVLEPLAAIIREDLQRRMVNEYCATGWVDNSKKEVSDKIAEVFAQSRYSEQLASDPFLRNFHIEQLAGRLGPQPEQEILDVAFCLDSEFDSIPEVKTLLSDPDYIHEKYGRYIEQQSGSSFTEAELSKAIKEALDMEGGVLSQEELLRDPFLRDQRCAELVYKEINEGRQPLTQILWKIDNVFFKSRELSEYLDGMRDNNADIFDDTNSAEVNRKVTDALAQVSDTEIIQIVNDYKISLHRGDQVVIDTLTPILGLQGEGPILVYKNKSQSENGANANYDYRSNTITCFERTSHPLLQPLRSLRRIADLEPPPYERIGTIAHEMWHARQYRSRNLSPEEKRLYLKNAQLYMGASLDYGLYRKQILEVEAFTFERAFEDRTRKVTKGLRKYSGGLGGGKYKSGSERATNGE